MKKRNVLIRYIAGIVLTAFSFTFALPINQVVAAEQAQQTRRQLQENQTKQIQSASGTKNPGKSQAKTRLGSFTVELTAWVEKFQADVDNGDLSQLKTDIKDAKQALKDIRVGIAAELDENEKTLQKLNAQNARERHNKFKAELDSNLNNFAALFDALDEIAAVLKDLKGGDISQLETLKAKITEINNLVDPEQADQPLGALPHNNVSVTPPAPATGAGISAAYMGSTPDTTASALPVTPTPEDLAETDEVKFTQAGKDLADSLNTPVDIYEYVRNNVNFEPYYGSRKGSAGTLEQMAGNDYDQASLLISLLRYKNIPARYVRGTVDIPIEKVQGWTGAETAEAAVKALGSLGIPMISLVSGGTISAVRLEHVWVEAYVPYENYRGTGAMTGQKIWVPLDPSFKQYQKLPGINLEEITGINSDQIVAALENNGEYSADCLAVTRVNTAAATNILSTATEKLQKYITDNGLENSKLEDVFGGYKIIEQKLGILPLSLPYQTDSVLAEMNMIPNELSDQVAFSIKGADPFNLNFGGANDFDFSL